MMHPKGGREVMNGSGSASIKPMLMFVVLAFLAIIILLFSGSAARRRQTSCQRGMRLVFRATVMYGNDYGDRLPDHPDDLSWAVDYLKPDDFKWALCPQFFLSDSSALSRGYGFNQKFEFIRPDKAQDKAFFWDGWDLAKNDPDLLSSVRYRHPKGTANIAFFDGHIKVFYAGTPDAVVFKP